MRAHPREAVLRAAPRHARRRGRARRRPRPRSGSRAFGFSDVARTRAALARAHAQGSTRRSRVMQQLLPGRARLALGRARSRPRAARSCAASPRAPTALAALAHTFRETPGRGRTRVPRARIEPRARARAASPTRLRRRARRRRRCSSRAHARRARRPKRSTRSTGATTSRRAAPGCAASSAGTCCASARATCSGSPTSTTTQRELAARSPTRASKPRCASLEPSLPFAVIGLGRLGGARAVVRVRHRRVVRLRRRRTPPSSTRPNDSPTRLVQALGATHRRRAGRSGIDANLRPEGKQGPLARSLDGYASLLRAVGAHVGVPGAATKARSSPATPQVAERFLELVAPVRVPRSRSPRRTSARSGG